MRRGGLLGGTSARAGPDVPSPDVPRGILPLSCVGNLPAPLNLFKEAPGCRLLPVGGGPSPMCLYIYIQHCAIIVYLQLPPGAPWVVKKRRPAGCNSALNLPTNINYPY